MSRCNDPKSRLQDTEKETNIEQNTNTALAEKLRTIELVHRDLSAKSETYKII